jgi:hypothetical protein
MLSKIKEFFTPLDKKRLILQSLLILLTWSVVSDNLLTGRGKLASFKETYHVALYGRRK